MKPQNLNTNESLPIEFKLDNGINVLLHEDHFAPVVAVQVWVNIGSADEEEGEFGLAHVLEHMLFKGTKKRATGEIAREVEEAGGVINAWTSFDRTVFHIAIEASRYEEALDILADAVNHSQIDAKELANELEVIQEEIKRGKDSPEHRLFEELFDLALSGHPYHRPIIGTPESVASFDHEKVLSFYKRWYRGSGLTIVLAGDFEAKEARENIEKLFGSEDNGQPPKHPKRGNPSQDKPRARIEEETLEEAHLAIGWEMPGIKSEDIAALDVLAIALGQSDSSRLVHLLRRKQGLVSDIICYPYAGRDLGMFLVEANLPSEMTLLARESILKETYRLTLEEISEEELEKAKTMVLSERIYNTQTVEGKAQQLGHFKTHTGDAMFHIKYIKAVQDLDCAALKVTAARYLLPQKENTVVLWPKGEENKPSIKDLTSPIATKSKKARKSAPQADKYGITRIQLPNGLRVLLRENRNVPLVSMQASLLAGLRFETKSNNGINNLLCQMLTLGTNDKDSLEIAEAIDGMGGSIQGFSGRNSVGLRSTVLSGNFDKGLKLFSDCLLSPSFEHSELTREKELIIEEIKTRNDHPAHAAFDLFQSTLYKKHPFSMTVAGKESSVSALLASDLRDYHERFVIPDETVLSIVGDIDTAGAIDQIEKNFGHLPQADIRRIAPITEEAPKEPRRSEKKLAKQQAHLIVGFQGMKLNDPGIYAIKILDAVLSGQGGRLFIELRDKKSLAYSVYFYSLALLDPGFMAVYIGTSPDKLEVAERGIMEELDKVLQDGITESELTRAQNYLIGNHAIGLQKNSSQCGVQMFNELYGVGYDAHMHFAERVKAVTCEEVKELARQYIKLDAPTVTIVKPE